MKKPCNSGLTMMLCVSAHMQGLRVPVSVAGAGGGTGVGTGTTNSPGPTPAVSLPFTLSPGAAAVLSQHGITTQALSRLYAATTTVTAVGGGGGAQTAPGGGGTLQRHLATGTGETTSADTPRQMGYDGEMFAGLPEECNMLGNALIYTHKIVS